jgi:DNA-directed RNA polymerase subunit RPC12/RpoP
MDLRYTCHECGTEIRRETDDDGEVDAAANCQCGAVYALTVTRLR